MVGSTIQSRIDENGKLIIEKIPHESNLIIIHTIIWVIVVLLIIVFIALLLRYIIAKKYENEVIKHSKRYNKLQEINKIYSNKFCDLAPENIYNKKMNNKNQFDLFNYDKFFMNTIKQEKEFYVKALNKANNNKNFFQDYINEINSIAPDTEIENKRFKSLYTKIENKLFDKEKLSPVTSIKMTCNLSYTSPKGRNHYKKDFHYDADDINKKLEYIDEYNNYTETKEYQRKLMTPTLRYEIMQRDGFKCVLCGRTAEDGVKLQVDHIKPVSKGGKTIKENLRTLCNECNLGKRDKYDENGLN